MPVSVSQVLSVGLALAVVYYVLGLLVSAVTRYILEIFNTRGRTLEGFLKTHLIGVVEKGKPLTLEKLKSMPQINSLKPVRYDGLLGVLLGRTKIIEYVERIPPKNLVDALFDLEGSIKKGKVSVKGVINNLPDKLVSLGEDADFALKKELQKLADAGFDDVEELRKKLETWAGGLMDQAGQHFKAYARRWVILTSFVVTFVLGVDSIALAKLYWNNATLAATADAQATLLLASSDEANQTDDVQKLVAQLEEMKATDQFWYQMPKDAPKDWTLWNLFLFKLPGMVITAIAVSQGSSFWYDIIRQIKGEQGRANPQPAKESA